MRKYLYLLGPVLVLLVFVSVAVAQTLTTDAPVAQKGLELALKLFFGFAVTAAGPIITGLAKGLPVWARYALASTGTILVGFGMGSIPDFPVTPESGAEMGVASGATAQSILRGLFKVSETTGPTS